MDDLRQKSKSVQSDNDNATSLANSELAANQMGRNLQISQIEKGDIEARSLFFVSGPVSCLTHQINRKVDAISEYLGQTVFFVFPIGDLCWINGLRLGTDEGISVREKAAIHACNIACGSVFSPAIRLTSFTKVLNAIAPGCVEMTPGKILHLRGQAGFSQQLHNELMLLQQSNPSSSLAIELQRSITTTLAMLVASTLHLKEPSSTTFAERRRVITESIDYIDANLANQLASPDVCRVVGVSKRKLERIFRRELEITPYEYVLLRRLNLAKNKLTGTDHSQSVSQIAGDCGFNHFSRFSGAYKSQFGLYPHQELHRGLVPAAI